MLKKLLILMGAVALLILVVFVINNSGDVSSSEQVDDQLIDALRVGVHYDIKNMGYQQYYDDELSGLEIDLAKLIAKYIYGKESLIELTSVSMKTSMYYLDDNAIDCIIATQPLTDEPSEEYLYSKAYYTDYIECMYINGSIMSLSDLAGKRIGIINGSYAAQKLEEALVQADIEAELIGYEGYSDCIDALQFGRLDAFCTNRVHVPGTTLKRFTVTDCKYAVVVRAENKELLDKINEALTYLESSGELKALQDKYR